MNIYSTFRKTQTHESSPVGIETRNTHVLPSTPPRIEFIQSYASLKRDVRFYKRMTLILLIICTICFLMLGFAYFKFIDMRDTYIMHNYTTHMNHVVHVKEGER